METKVIDLAKAKVRSRKASSAFDEQLVETLDALAAAAEELRTNLFNLAMRGPWRDWDAEAPVGATMNVDTNMLLQTGDDRILRLARVMAHAQDVVHELRGERAGDGHAD